MLKSREEVWRSLQHVRSTALRWLLAYCFALCVADLPSSNVYRITALLSRITYIRKSENIFTVWTTIFFSKLFWCGRPIISAKKKRAWFSPDKVHLGRGELGFGLGQALFWLKKMVDQNKRHKILPDFCTLSSIIIQWCGEGYYTATASFFFFSNLLLFFDHHFYFPAQLVGGFTLSDLLNKSRGHSCRLFSPPVRAFIFVAHRVQHAPCYVEWKWLKMTAQRPERILYLCLM